MGKSESLRRNVRRALCEAGRRLGPDRLADARVALGYLELGAWSAGQERPKARRGKSDLFIEALTQVKGLRPVYLEFGVFEGSSLSWWSTRLHELDARFFGFDSFEGLPEDWRPGLSKGTFAVDRLPSIADARVQLVKGWFSDTLATFVIPEHDQLIVNVDCDLYSSALTVLKWVDEHLRPGDLLYFDELADRDHEYRAMREWLDMSDHHLVPLATSDGGLRWLFAVA